MTKVPIRSRNGNLVLAFLGAVYAISAFVVLIWFVIDAWAAEALIDRLLQLSLAATVGGGIWFIAVAMDNLGIRRNDHRRVTGH